MFWEELTDEEADEYIRLNKKVKPWLQWQHMSKKELREALERGETEPTTPPDEHFLRIEQIARKGWGTK